MKRKKRGNSLIVVITTCMFVTSVSAATLTMVAGNYKARAVESKRVENLYSSDSGLDVAYNVIGKTFDAAAKYGYYEVEALKREDINRDSITENNNRYRACKTEIRNSLNRINMLKEQSSITSSQNNEIAHLNKVIEDDYKEINEIINDEFKRTFQNFINGTNIEGISETDENNTYKLSKYIWNGNYVNEITYNSANNDTPFTFTTVKVKYPENSTPKLWIPENGVSNQDGVIENSNGLSYNDGKFTITVKSRFKTQNENENAIGANSRIVQATYTMSVPNYDDIFYKQDGGELHEYLALKDRALTIGGDMNVGSEPGVYDTNLNVNKGEVFVNGNPDKSTSERVYGKYFGGIILNNVNSILFGDNVITRGTFNIRDQVGSAGHPAEIKGDLYARNIYAGTENGQNYTDKAYLKVDNDAVMDNDLALKATNTHVTIKNFYGINDKNIYYDDNNGNRILNGDSNPNDKARTSSSIIINGYTDTNGGNPSSVQITDKAYIMGTAHIATDGDYQTGESTAVKNKGKANYEAYSVPWDSSDTPENFIYDNPLQVLDESNVFKKAKHFVNYWTGKEVDTGGIYLPKDNIYSVGAIVYKHKDLALSQDIVEITNPNYSADLEGDNGEITSKRIKFASIVYKFGKEATTDDEKKEMLSSYDSLGTNSTKVSDFMTLSNDTVRDKYSLGDDKYRLDDEINSVGEKAIFNCDPQNTIVIQGAHASKSYDPRVYKVIDASTDREVRAVIASKGDVIIDGDVNFHGSIITDRGTKSDGKTTGNLTVTGNVLINYDEDTIDRIQAQNYILFNNVFGSNMLGEEESTPVQTNQHIDITNMNYDLKKFLQSGKWKIIN